MRLKYQLLFLAIIILFWQACTVKKYIGPQQNVNLDSALVKIKLQERKVFSFESSDVYFSNNFKGARLNQIESVNDSTFNIAIEPENTPINQSPWFAFKVWGAEGKNVYINLNYPTAKHRYKPKLSTNGKVWESIENVLLNQEKTQASFRLQLRKDTFTVAAQEIISSKQSYEWMDELSKRKRLKKEVIGYSIGGKPIVALTSTKSDGKKLIVIVSRQHPPEVSGYMAMTEFVETLLGNSPVAKSFAKNYELVIIPMLNPDGVDEGNWRHNFGGVDLNRDWTDFKQPEIKSVSDYLLAKVKNQDAKVHFALDFHSTYNDILYTNAGDDITHQPGLVIKWIERLHEFEGENKTKVEGSTNTNNLSKAWIARTFNAEALIYEVGDNTPRSFIKEKAQKSAAILMEELSKR